MKRRIVAALVVAAMGFDVPHGHYITCGLEDTPTERTSVPASEVARSPEPAAELPADTRDWDEIGCFVLKDADADATVWLYHSSRNTIWRKQAERAGEQEHEMAFPDSCGIHAVYRVGAGPWRYRKVYGASYLSVTRVDEVRKDGVRILFRWRGPAWSGVVKMSGGIPVIRDRQDVLESANGDSANDFNLDPIAKAQLERLRAALDAKK